MQESRNIYDLLSKIDWEGGIAEVLDYGERDIDDYEVSDELKEAWADMADAYSEFETTMATVGLRLTEEENLFEERKGL